jgi:hypothetical protein
MRIDPNGNVGIGTTGPGATLQVYKNSATQAIFNGWEPTYGAAADSGAIMIGSVANYQGIIRYTGGTVATAPALYIENSYNSDTLGNIYFRTKTAGTAVNAMTILGNGNLGIGTTSPASKLHVTGSVVGTIAELYNTEANDGNGLYIKAGGINSGKYALVVDNNASSRILTALANGNVGIGTTGPDVKVHVLGASYSTASSVNINVKFQGGGGNGLGFGTIDATSTYASWIQSGYVSNFGTATYNLLLNPLGGNVGIGTISPELKFDVNGDAQIRGYVELSEADGSRNGLISTYKAITGSGSDRSLAIFTEGGSNGDDLHFMTGGFATSKMTILSGGNVGIGTATPTAKLDVSGTIRQGPLVARPLATWSVGGASAGAILIKLPGTLSNYGMVHMEINTYEYSGNAATTYICGGHNWSNAWYNYSCSTNGTSDKKIRLAVKDGQYTIVIGEYGSGWSYGHVVLSKITLGGYYSGTMDLGGTYSITQDNSPESYTWISGDLNRFNSGNGYFTGNVSAASFTDRTPYPKDLETAYDAVLSMQRLPDGQYSENNKEQQLDHSLLSSFVQSVGGFRDLSASVSSQNEILKYLLNNLGGINSSLRVSGPNGNVGIGTNNPTQKLTVTGSINLIGGSFMADGVNLNTAITGLTENQNKIVNQLTSSANELSDQNLTIDGKIALIGQALDNIQTRLIASLQEQIDLQTQDLASLQKQMADIQLQNKDFNEFLIAFDVKNIDNFAKLNAPISTFTGQLEAQSLVAGAFSVKVSDSTKKTLGEAVICEAGKILREGECETPAGEEVASDGKMAEIKTKAVSDSSRIFVTPIGKTPVDWIVDEIDPGVGFSIILEEATSQTIKFNWWIVEEK